MQRCPKSFDARAKELYPEKPLPKDSLPALQERNLQTSMPMQQRVQENIAEVMKGNDEQGLSSLV